MIVDLTDIEWPLEILRLERHFDFKWPETIIVTPKQFNDLRTSIIGYECQILNPLELDFGIQNIPKVTVKINYFKK